MSFVTSRRWALKETFRGLRRDAALYIFAVLLSGLALSIPLFIYSVAYGLSEPVRNLPTAAELTVFTTANANSEEVAASIEAAPFVEHVRLVKRDEAFRELNESLGIKSGNSLKNPLPDVLIVTLASHVTTAEIESTARTIEQLRGVDFVPYETAWHEKLNAVTHAALVGFACLGTIVLLVVVLVLTAAVRMTTASASTEMRALHLFGASPFFAVRPYAWRGAILMGASAAAGLLVARGALAVFAGPVAATAALYDAEVTLGLPPIEWELALVGIASLAGGFVAALAAADVWRRLR